MIKITKMRHSDQHLTHIIVKTSSLRRCCHNAIMYQFLDKSRKSLLCQQFISTNFRLVEFAILVLLARPLPPQHFQVPCFVVICFPFLTPNASVTVSGNFEVNLHGTKMAIYVYELLFLNFSTHGLHSLILNRTAVNTCI